MDRDRSPSTRSFVLMAAVLGGHVVLILMVMQMRSRELTPADTELHDSSILYLPSLTEPESTPAVTSPRATAHRKERAPPAKSATAQSESATAEEPSGNSSVTPEPSVPPVDWFGEARRSAESTTADLMARQDHSCITRARPGSLLPPCGKAPRTPQWEPPPKRFGLADGFLPYVRINKRCVVGLGFFGCAMGRLPDADGHLLDDMHNPNRDHSSVPDTNDVNEFDAYQPQPSAPRPLVR